jgi:hypothetical protein
MLEHQIALLKITGLENDLTVCNTVDLRNLPFTSMVILYSLNMVLFLQSHKKKLCLKMINIQTDKQKTCLIYAIGVHLLEKQKNGVFWDVIPFVWTEPTISEDYVPSILRSKSL